MLFWMACDSNPRSSCCELSKVEFQLVYDMMVELLNREFLFSLQGQLHSRAFLVPETSNLAGNKTDNKNLPKIV